MDEMGMEQERRRERTEEVLSNVSAAVAPVLPVGHKSVQLLDATAERTGFKSQRCRVTVLGKLFTPIVPLFTKQRNWQQPSSGLRA